MRPTHHDEKIRLLQLLDFKGVSEAVQHSIGPCKIIHMIPDGDEQERRKNTRDIELT